MIPWFSGRCRTEDPSGAGPGNLGGFCAQAGDGSCECEKGELPLPPQNSYSTFLALWRVGISSRLLEMGVGDAVWDPPPPQGAGGDGEVSCPTSLQGRGGGRGGVFSSPHFGC